MKTKLGLLILLLAVGLFSFADGGQRWIEVEKGGYGLKPEVSVLRSDFSSIVMSFKLEGYFCGEELTPKGEFITLQLPGYGFNTDVGRPKLPVIREMVEIPYGAELKVRVYNIGRMETDLKDLGMEGRIIPVQPPQPKVPGQRAEFEIDEGYYGRDEWHLSQVVQVSETGIMRGHRFALLEIYPFAYNPSQGRIKILSRVEVRLDLVGSDLVKTERRWERYSSPPFKELGRKLFINWDYYHRIGKDLPTLPIGYLIITTDDFSQGIQSLAGWKGKKGYYISVARTSEIGSSTGEIKSYIQDAYDNWPIPPTYLLLVGDTDRIPCYTGSHPPTDLYYTTLEGGDYIPDVHIGRISVDDTTELSGLVEKIRNYERADWVSQPGWSQRVYFMASNDESFHGVAEGTHNYCMALCRANGMICDSLYAYYGTGTSIATALNGGRVMAVYSGHGGYYSWGGPSFSQSNIRSLTNVDMYPFVCSHACNTGDFTKSECFGETWIRVKDKGAIAFWGSSVGSYWPEDDILQRRMFDALFDSSITWLAGMTDEAKWLLYQHYGGGGSTHRYYEQYNLLGDPSVDLWTKAPDSLIVDYPLMLPPGSSEFVVNVSDNSGPIDGALVALYMDDVLYGIAYSFSGVADVSLDPVVPDTTGLMEVAVTKHNYIPYEGTAQICSPAVVEIEPDSINVGMPTQVVIRVSEPSKGGIDSVIVTISGWGINPPLVDTTDANGEAVMEVDAPYGEILNVVGRKINKGYNLFSDSLWVVEALALSFADLSARVSKFGLVDTLTPNQVGTITGDCSEAGFTLYAKGCGIDTFAFTEDTTVDLRITPQSIGEVTSVIAKPGYNIYSEPIPVLTFYGYLVGVVMDSSSSDSLAGVVIDGYEGGADTSLVQPAFSVVTDVDGSYDLDSLLVIGQYDVYIRYFGYEAFGGTITVMPGSNNYNISLIPSPRGVVSGKTLEEGIGDPLSAIIRIYLYANMELYTTVYTDSLNGGNYSVTLPYSDYLFKVTSSRHIPINVLIVVDEPIQLYDFEMVAADYNILVIDDDDGFRNIGTKRNPVYMKMDNSNKEASTFETILTALGYSVTVDSSSKTDPITWLDYDLLVWSDGSNANPLEVSQYRTDLENYVKSGGKLFIEGGEIAWSAYEGAPDAPWTSFRRNILHIPEAGDIWDSDVAGDLKVTLFYHPIVTVPNNLSDTMSFKYTGVTCSDAVNMQSGTDADLVIGWTDYPDDPGVLAYDDDSDPSNGGQIVFYSFDIANIDSAADRQALVDNTTTWLMGIPVGIKGGETSFRLPQEFSLSQNYPNPFNATAVLRYGLPADGRRRTAVTLKVYNILGQKVATLVDQEQKPGYYDILWDASSLSSGIYFYHLDAGEFSQTRKMLLLR